MKYGEPNIAIEIDNNKIGTTKLGNYQDIDILYDPVIQQVFVKNTSTTQTYYMVFSYHGNTAKTGNIIPTVVPDPTNNVPIIMNPGAEVHFTRTGSIDTNYCIKNVGDRFILDDLTIYKDNQETFRADMNNQNLSNAPINKNGILMSSVITKAPVEKLHEKA